MLTTLGAVKAEGEGGEGRKVSDSFCQPFRREESSFLSWAVLKSPTTAIMALSGTAYSLKTETRSSCEKRITFSGVPRTFMPYGWGEKRSFLNSLMATDGM